MGKPAPIPPASRNPTNCNPFPVKLIIITGLPTSGKSTRAKQLEAYLAERIQSQGAGSAAPRYRLHMVSDQTQSIPRSVYDLSAEGQPAHTRSANASEKDARAAIYAAARRVLGPRDVVVLDGLNYIKGWRYQLFCEARGAETPSCVLQVGCTVERARRVNERRLERRERKRTAGDGGAVEAKVEGDDITSRPKEEREEDDEFEDDEEPYEPANWENLVYRYEEPNPMTRWDSPLFTLIWEDDEARTRQVFDSIWDAIAGERKNIARPKATLQRDKDYGGDYLYMLEKETQDVVKKILELQGDEGAEKLGYLGEAGRPTERS
jgi:protein KTI12